ncbi:MAG TPA: MaoC family dehydratase [Bradyrhizobium sp.]|nr:MaoC family dehydratase [Bradyrhizobium sp.]
MWFEDLEIGTRRDLGTYVFTEDEIIAFGKKYDPQIFHVDPAAAKQSMFGGLIASGWHTAAVWMKLAIAERERARHEGKTLARSGVSPGFEDMRWIKPVRPGVTYRFSSETIEKIELKSRNDIGLVKSRNEARDEAGELAFSFIGKGFVQRRPAA